MQRDLIHWFSGMGFRPAALATSRDQYGDHVVLLVGDDSPLEGKVPPGMDRFEPSFDPYQLTSAPPSLLASPPSGPALPPTSVVTVPGSPDLPPLASVDLAGAGEFLGAVVLIALVTWACLKLVSVDESCRGTSDGCSGHV